MHHRSLIQPGSLQSQLQRVGDASAFIERGENVKLSSFGLFVVRKKGQRMGRNPKAGEEVPIAPRRVVMFKPSRSSSSGSMPGS